MDSEELIKNYTKDFSVSPEFLNLPNHLKAEATQDVETFLEFLFNYELDDLKEIKPRNIKTVLTEIFPRKVSAEPEELRNFIPVLVSFFESLKVKGVVKDTPALIKSVKDSEEEMLKNAKNPEYFGMAKSLVMQMKKDGVNFEDKEAVDRWIFNYNQRQTAVPEEPQGTTPFSKTGHDVGRNDPCPCGSGKKYKKCCLNPVRNTAKTEGDNKISNGVNKQNDLLVPPPIKDYGKAQLSSGFFAENPIKEISAARLVYSCLLNPGVEQVAAETARLHIPEKRWKEEAGKISRETDLGGLLKIMGEEPDSLNQALLKKKILSFAKPAISRIIEKLRDNQDDVFVELG